MVYGRIRTDVTFTPSYVSLCVYALCVEMAALPASNFSFFFPFSFFFFPLIHGFHGPRRLSSPILVEEEEEDARTYDRGGETRHWASDFAADFTRKSFFDFGQRGYTNDDPLRFQGEGNLITRLKFRIPRHPMIGPARVKTRGNAIERLHDRSIEGVGYIGKAARQSVIAPSKGCLRLYLRYLKVRTCTRDE